MEHKLSIPIAIVLAGVLISGALLITRGTTSPIADAGDAQTASVAVAPISEEDHILGNPRADVVIVEYSDTECPYCKRFHTTMHEVIDTYGRDGTAAWVYRHFPIDTLHKKARKEAEATECAAEIGGNDGFWKYIDRLYEVTPSNDGLSPSELPKIAKEVGLDEQRFANCLSSGKYADKIESQYQDAVKAGGRGTPHSVLISREKLNTETLDLIRTASQELPARTITISEDQTKVIVMGALPFDFLKLLIDSMSGSSE